MSTARYCRGPDEPGGSGEVIAEVVDGIMHRRIEREGMTVNCIDYGEYPVRIDMTAVSDYVWEISQREFEREWTRYCTCP
jgi:hypothetical protein